MKKTAISLISSFGDAGNISGLGSAAYKDAGNNAGNVPVVMPSGKLDSSILPTLQITNVFTADDQEGMLALSASKGDICVRTDENKTYILSDTPASTLSNWVEIALTASVQSVNNKTGIVTLNAADVNAVESNESITGATKCKITYDSKGLVTAGSDLAASDLPSHEHAATDITSGVLPIANGGTGANTQAGARTNLDVYSKAETDALIPTDLSQLSNTTTNYINNTQLQDAIERMGNIFTLKGSVNDTTDLPSDNNELGDVYYVTNEDKTYVWMNDGTSDTWQEFGSTLDISDCVKKSELLSSTGNATTNTMSQYAITQALNGKADTADIPSQLTDLTGILPVTQGGTGNNTLTSGDFIIGNGTNAVTTLSTVPIAKGGTGATTASQARTNLGVYTRNTLYSNSNGTSGTITLNDSANNYKWIEIHYGWKEIFHSVNMTPNTNGNKIVNLSLSYTTSDSAWIVFRNALIYVNGSTITWSRNRTEYIVMGNPDSSSVDTSGKISIFGVYGFKS